MGGAGAVDAGRHAACGGHACRPAGQPPRPGLPCGCCCDSHQRASRASPAAPRLLQQPHLLPPRGLLQVRPTLPCRMMTMVGMLVVMIVCLVPLPGASKRLGVLNYAVLRTQIHSRILVQRFGRGWHYWCTPSAVLMPGAGEQVPGGTRTSTASITGIVCIDAAFVCK